MIAKDVRERLAIILPLTFAFFLAWSFRLFGFRDAVLSVLTGTAPANVIPSPVSEAAFIQQAVLVEFPAPIDYSPIQEVCGRTPFRPGLVFTCEGQHGGIGMLRNQMLKCIRYAIHGGGALVVPSIALRNSKDLKDIETAIEMPLEYLLERETFKKYLTAGCPQMKIYDHVEDVPFYSQRQGQPLQLLGDQFEPDHPRTGLRHPRAWRQNFDGWLAKQDIHLQSERPVHIQMEQSFLEYPVRDDGDAFVHEFGKILSFRKDTRELAAKVLYELRTRFDLPIDPAVAINPGAYYGAHLRLESDAIWAWPPSEWRFSRMHDQFEEQYRNVKRTGLRTVYVASGNQTVVYMFADYLAKKLGSDVRVVTKQDLLQPDDMQRLAAMTFDQQALVDFMVMFKASAFMGVAHSSFPWNVALRRHELSRYAAYANEGSDLLRDEYSIIMGMAADYPYVDSFVTSIWP
ncbi:hypothetical protein SEUCBS139899_009283 [Sporothrix eucalyptigena]|uniref:Alternative oxidase n=1 Tax=Sporothrix eucalyptigena TaxID=1812306 RepID=A0ABP0CPQ8_9PEZI